MPWVEWRGNKCRVRWETGKVDPETGRKLYDSKSGFTDEDEAYNYGLDRESDVRNGRYISRRDGSMPMKDWGEAWLDAQDLRYNSMRSYRSIVKTHITPHWGRTTVSEITSLAYNRWTKGLRAKYEKNTVDGILSVFNMLMNDAVDNEMRASSPVPKTRRRGRYVKPQREKKRPMDLAVVHRLALNANDVWGYAGYVFFLTVAFTGMRRAELYALRREFIFPNWPATDPDPERREESIERYAGEKPMPAIRVQYQHQYVDGKPSLEDPKYGSHRTLVLPRFLAEMHKTLLASHTSEWVFPAMSGGPLIQTEFTESYWNPIVDGADARSGRYARPEILPVEEFRGKRLHLVRHGHKEWLDEDDQHARVAVESRMGHEVAGVEGLYSNVTPVMERRIMESLQERWELFVRQQGPDWRPPSPTPLPVDVESTP